MIVKSLAINQNWLDPDQLAIGSFSGAVGLPTIETPGATDGLLYRRSDWEVSQFPSSQNKKISLARLLRESF